METIKIIIERSVDMFSAYADNVEGIYGGGDTVEEAKQSILDAIRLLKEHNTEENIPAILKGEYEISYCFDTESLLSYYKGIFTQAALERITGINQRLIQQYATGAKKPRPAQKEKITKALHKLGHEILAVELNY